MIQKYKKKPVEIEAVQWTGDNYEEILKFASSAQYYIKSVNNSIVKMMIINTLEGNMTAALGDYIIKGVDGEFYPCKPDIFYKTYDIVENDTAKISYIKDKCDKCIWSNECYGPYKYDTINYTCSLGYTYKRDPPDGGYYG